LNGRRRATHNVAETFNTGDDLVKGMNKSEKNEEAGFACIGWLLEVLTSFLVVALVVVSLLSLVV
jgi:hypothetical protein